MNDFFNRKEALIKAIAEEKRKLEQQLEKENEELTFLTKIWDTTETDYLKIVASTDIIDMLCAIILSDEKNNGTVSEIKQLLEENRHLHENINSKEARTLIFTFADLEAHNFYDGLKQITSPGHKRKLVENGIIMGMKILLKLGGTRKINLYPFMQTVDLYPNYIDGLLCIKIIKDHLKEKNNMRDNIDKSTLRLIEQLGLAEEDVKKSFDINKAKKQLFQARGYYDQLKQKNLSEKRAYRRELVAYETLEENLDKLFKNNEITNINDLLFRISNPTIRIDLLKLIYLHNQRIYDVLSEEYQNLLKDPSKIYQSILSKYGISAELYQVPEILSNTPEDLEEILKSLKAIGIVDENLIIEIIKKSDLETVQMISQQVSKGYIDTKLLNNNLGLFSKDSIEYKNFIANLDYFIEEGINPHYLRVDQELFLMSPTIIKKNIQTLKEYNLLSTMKTGNSCRFLINKNLETGIDTLLELGYEASLVEDLSILNYQNNFKRLHLLKILNIPVESIEELKQVLSSEKFIVPTDTIDSYLYNANISQEEQPDLEIIPAEFLSEYSASSRTYNINGILISKNKVKRNITNFDDPISSISLLTAITANSFFSDEELSVLKNTFTKEKCEKEYIKIE